MMKFFVLFLTIWISCAYAETDNSSYQGKIDKESFWKVYTNALRGDKVAQFQTGVMFERGIGVEVNQTQAAKWYEKSAIQGYIDAQYNIGIMYASGRGVELNENFAMMWLAAAAKQGDEESRKLLNAMLDGKVKEKESVPEKTDSTETTGIKPIRFVVKEGGKICSKPGNGGTCTKADEKKAFTSGMKSGPYYKVTGVISDHKWKAYEQEGWIEESTMRILQ